MMAEYTLSWYTIEKVPMLVRRPWWNIFGRDRIEFIDKWVRKVHHRIPEDEALILIEHIGQYKLHPMTYLIHRLMGKSLNSIQLEVSGEASEYIAFGNAPTSAK